MCLALHMEYINIKGDEVWQTRKKTFGRKKNRIELVFFFVKLCVSLTH
jgi:hypothetical protein